MAVSKKTAWIVSACGTAALILFFFVDLPVARQLYRPGTGFGAFFRVAAPLMPPLCGLLFSGCLARTTEEPVGWRLFGAASSAVYSAAGGFLFFYYLGVRRPVATLLLAAALCVPLDLANNYIPWDTSLLLQSVLGGLTVTVMELLAGLVINVWLGLRVWDYSRQWGNLWGQICPKFALLWCLLAGAVIVLFDYMDFWLGGGERPRYKIL